MEQISEGGFVVEPGNLWRRRLKRRHLADAPRVSGEGGDAVFTCNSMPPTRMPVKSVPWHDDQLASSDAWSRPEAMDRAGIRTQVVFPTFAWSLFGIEDEALRADCARSYNHWIFDLCVTSPTRLRPAILVPQGAAGREELERCLSSRARLALGAVIICVGDQGAPALQSLLAPLKECGAPVVACKSGGATPLGDMTLFTKEAATLARECSGHGFSLAAPEWRGGAVLTFPVT